jgi:hypothetical protein
LSRLRTGFVSVVVNVEGEVSGYARTVPGVLLKRMANAAARPTRPIRMLMERVLRGGLAKAVSSFTMGAKKPTLSSGFGQEVGNA